MKLEKKKKINNNPFLPNSQDFSAWLLLLPAVLCIYLFVIRPQVMGIYWSFFNMKGYKVQEFVGLANYRQVISDTMFVKTMWNTFQYVLWSLVLGFLLPIFVAVILNE